MKYILITLMLLCVNLHAFTDKEKRIIHLLKMPPESMSHKQDVELANWIADNINNKEEVEKILKAAWGKK